MLRRIDHAARSTGGASLCVDLLGIRWEGLPIALNARPKPDAKNAFIGAGGGVEGAKTNPKMSPKRARKSNDSAEESSWKKCPKYDEKSFSSGLAGGSKAQP